MSDKLRLDFIASDFAGNSYIDNEDCACVRAFKRQFPDAKLVHVGGSEIHFDDQTYDFGPVYLDGELIEAEGFGMLAFIDIRAAFDRNPDTKAYMEIID